MGFVSWGVPAFRYDAIAADGARTSGLIEAATEAAALVDLRARKLRPIRVEPAKASRAAVFTRSSPGQGRLGIRLLANTFTQLGDLLRAGVPLLRALNLIAERKSQPALSHVFRDLSDRVSEGEELAEAMASRPKQFSRVQVAMVRAGEHAGNLDDVLTGLGRMLEAQANLAGKVVGSLVYPSVLIVAGLGILTVVFTVFVPMFRPLLARLGDDLPGPTILVFGVSDALTTHGLITALVLGGVVGVALWARTRADVQHAWAVFQTRLPIWGPLVRALATARFCRLLGSMLGSGVPLLGAMAIAREAANNPLMERAIDQASEAVTAGEPLAEPLRVSGLFDDDVIEMISVGENANNLETVLGTIADAIEQRIDRLLGVVLKLIEPIMLMGIAGVVVVVAIALLIPMTQLSGRV